MGVNGLGGLERIPVTPDQTRTSQPDERLPFITGENWAGSFRIFLNLISFEKMEFIRTMNISCVISLNLWLRPIQYSNMLEKYDYGFVAPRSPIWSCYKSNEKPAVNQISEDSGLCHQIKSLILSSTAFYSAHVPPSSSMYLHIQDWFIL